MTMWDYSEASQTDEKRDQAIAAARETLAGASHVLLGAGAGLSAAAGLSYFGERFDDHFKNFIDYYGLTDMYSASLYPFPDEESKWAYWAEHIWMNRYNPPALPLYEQLFSFFGNRDCFVLTTNVDAQFTKAGFPKSRVFATQGDYGFMQCQNACHGVVYSNKEAVNAIRLNTRAGERVRISDSALVPTCPKCGAPMTPWLRNDESFVKNEDWLAAQERYHAWLDAALASGSLVLLELGVGFNAPDVIRFPFERIAVEHDLAFIRMNYESAAIGAPDLRHGISVQGDLAITWPLVSGQH